MSVVLSLSSGNCAKTERAGSVIYGRSITATSRGVGVTRLHNALTQSFAATSQRAATVPRSHCVQAATSREI